MDKDDLGEEVDMEKVLGVDDDIELTVMVPDPDERAQEPLLIGLMMDTYPIAAPNVDEVEAEPLVVGLSLEQAEELHAKLAITIAVAKEIEREEAKKGDVVLN